MSHSTTSARPSQWLAGAVIGLTMLAGLGLALVTAGHGQVGGVTSSVASTSTPTGPSGKRWG
jgi:hypothetical protein